MTQEIYGPAATARAAALIAAGKVVPLSEVFPGLTAVIANRRAAAKCGAGQTKKNLGSGKAAVKASALATKANCWLCEGVIVSDDPARSFEKDHVAGGTDHLYSIASVATAHAFCNRVRGNLQAAGFDLADILDRANALPMPVRAQAEKRAIVTGDYSDLI